MPDPKATFSDASKSSVPLSLARSQFIAYQDPPRAVDKSSDSLDGLNQDEKGTQPTLASTEALPTRGSFATSRKGSRKTVPGLKFYRDDIRTKGTRNRVLGILNMPKGFANLKHQPRSEELPYFGGYRATDQLEIFQWSVQKAGLDY